MGYQVVEATKWGNYVREKFLVLNSEIVIELNATTGDNVRKVLNEGVFAFKAKASIIALNSITVLNEKQFRNIVNEPRNDNERGAIENPVVNANVKKFLFVFPHLITTEGLIKSTSVYAPVHIQQQWKII